jgi:hypothetical protein
MVSLIIQMYLIHLWLRTSHIIRKTKYVKESNRVEGEIKLLSRYWGKEAQALVEDKCPIFVSSKRQV